MLLVCYLLKEQLTKPLCRKRSWRISRLYSGMWRSAVWYVGSKVSKQNAAAIFWADSSNLKMEAVVPFGTFKILYQNKQRHTLKDSDLSNARLEVPTAVLLKIQIFLRRYAVLLGVKFLALRIIALSSSSVSSNLKLLDLTVGSCRSMQ